MHLSAAMSGAMMSATLISAAVGGLGFGWFADRLGRVRALSLSILGYSVATAMCGFTHTAWQLMACRILLGLGMGGEWASGAALVAETWPSRQRAGAGTELLGAGLRAGCGGGGRSDAPLWMAGSFLCGGPAGTGDAMGAARIARAGGLDGAKGGANANGPAVSRCAGPQCAHLRHHECRCSFCLVGTVHLGAALLVHVCRRGRTGLEHRADFRMDHRDAGRHVSGLCLLRIHCRSVQPQVHLHRLSADCGAAGAAVCFCARPERT